MKELNPSRVNFGIFHILVALRDAGLLHKVAVTPLAHYATGVLCKANTAVFLKKSTSHLSVAIVAVLYLLHKLVPVWIAL